jgi:hypothetical protein
MDEYTVNIGGIDHTMLLDADDAKRLGATPVKATPAPEAKAAAPANKSRATDAKAK